MWKDFIGTGKSCAKTSMNGCSLWPTNWFQSFSYLAVLALCQLFFALRPEKKIDKCFRFANETVSASTQCIVQSHVFAISVSISSLSKSWSLLLWLWELVKRKCTTVQYIFAKPNIMQLCKLKSFLIAVLYKKTNCHLMHPIVWGLHWISHIHTLLINIGFQKLSLCF